MEPKILRLAASKHKTGFRGPTPDVGKATRFKKGQSGNPGGRPKAIISDWLRHELTALDSQTQEEIARKLAHVLIQRALAGDVKAIQIIADRVEGRPVQMETPNTSQEPTKIVVEYIGVD